MTEQTLTVRTAFLDTLMDQLAKENYEKGYAAGEREARVFHVDEYLGSVTHIVVIEGKTRNELRRKFREMNVGHVDTGCGYDCSGRICGRYAKALRYYRVHGEAGVQWRGIIEATITYDV